MDAIEVDTGAAGAGAPLDAAQDRRVSLRNAVKLAASLAFTWTIALGTRFVLPRHLGPSRFGDFSFAEAFTATFFVALSLGIDTYVYREVARRPAHASEFFGSVVAARGLLAALLLPVMALVLHLTHPGGGPLLLVALFAATQLLVAMNGTFQALLHARATVDGLSVATVLAKLVWALGIGAAVVLGGGAWAFVVAALASEALKAGALWVLARRHLALRFRIDVAAGRRALAASVPFYVNAIVLAVFSKLDVSILAMRAGAAEVGYYGVANTIAALALVAAPILGSVFYPLISRAAARSDAELTELVRRGLEIVIALAVPVTLGIVLGAELVIRVLFGAPYAPAALALAILAPMMLLTYVNIVCAVTLNVLGRTWTVALATAIGIVLDAALNLGLLGPAMRLLDRPGAGGAACALAMVASEALVTIALLRAVGRLVFDRQGATRAARSLAAGAVMCGAHLLLAGLGPARLAADAAVYLAAAFALRALTLSDVAALRDLVARRPRST
jgi:O-antigen/teichoic acid export membrane protein